MKEGYEIGFSKHSVTVLVCQDQHWQRWSHYSSSYLLLVFWSFYLLADIFLEKLYATVISSSVWYTKFCFSWILVQKKKLTRAEFYWIRNIEYCLKIPKCGEEGRCDFIMSQCTCSVGCIKPINMCTTYCNNYIFQYLRKKFECESQ